MVLLQFWQVARVMLPRLHALHAVYIAGAARPVHILYAEIMLACLSG
jgi:hypothetical protein